MAGATPWSLSSIHLLLLLIMPTKSREGPLCVSFPHVKSFTHSSTILRCALICHIYGLWGQRPFTSCALSKFPHHWGKEPSSFNTLPHSRSKISQMAKDAKARYPNKITIGIRYFFHSNFDPRSNLNCFFSSLIYYF